MRRVAVLVLAFGMLIGFAAPALAATTPAAAPRASPATTSLAATPAATSPTATPLAEAAGGLYTDPNSPAAQAARAGLGTGAARLAQVPQARWFTERDSTASVNTYVAGATAARAMPVLVVYAVPNRDCGSFSAGGFSTLAQYQTWIRQVRAGIAGRPAAVIVEPDSLVGTSCLSGQALTDRYSAIRYAAQTLGQDPGTLVYIDGGHSRWLSAADLASRLRQVGAPTTRGFALNVSNFFTTAEENAYGEQVSALLGGVRYLVDTSRNGAGPAPDAPLNWCNPAGRLLGTLPTTATSAPHADAYLWIKNPGQSDGTCNRGNPPSGAWFTAWADDIVARTLAGG